ncbi:hypothetical protein CK222_23610 [Mesorhizobium sp. WSM3866]|uniref:hypothetical protein n=1 Tax=Mesorhizobium sp. WSM3866 TaxID=422271 RepID=UPI000BAF059E|nr:hypothetical protein [Mesorhizobium sp. WSM3866]PBB41162.1 hypothetical protein CK222_23610 [Mesorhizobium sp. WSM3866]
MSGRLAGYAAEIERYLRAEAGVKREELDDDKSATGARRAASEFQAMKNYERAGRGGRLGQAQAGSTVGGGSNAPRSSPGGASLAVSSVSSKPPKAASSPEATGVPIMVYGATLAGFRPEEEEEDWKRHGGGGGRGAGRPSGTGRAARAGYQAGAVAARAGYAAGAQPAVFKVMPNPPSTKEAAARLLNYIGKPRTKKARSTTSRFLTRMDRSLRQAAHERRSWKGFARRSNHPWKIPILSRFVSSSPARSPMPP